MGIIALVFFSRHDDKYREKLLGHRISWQIVHGERDKELDARMKSSSLGLFDPRSRYALLDVTGSCSFWQDWTQWFLRAARTVRPCLYIDHFAFMPIRCHVLKIASSITIRFCSLARHLCPCTLSCVFAVTNCVRARALEAYHPRLLFCAYVMRSIENDHDGYARLSRLRRHSHVYFRWNTIPYFACAWALKMHAHTHTYMNAYEGEISLLRLSSPERDVSPGSVYWDADVHQCMIY